MTDKIQEKLDKRRQERLSELEAIRKSPRANAVFVAAPDAECTTARFIQGTYAQDSENLPELPYEGCSRADGCICRYEPLVVEVGP